MFDVFKEFGLQVLPKVVRPEDIEAARMEAEILLPSQDAFFYEAVFEQSDLETRAPHALHLQSCARDIARRVTGREPVLRQNQLVRVRSGSPGGTKAHIDGSRHILTTGGTWDFMPSFQIIIGFPLVDLSVPGRGSVWFEPGGHRRMTEFIHRSWAEITAGGTSHGFKLAHAHADKTTERQLALAEVGDAFFFHASMPHGTSPNDGPDRPIWYFRYGVYTVTGREGYREVFPVESWPALAR